MPEIGEIKCGEEIGKGRRDKYIWDACVNCGKGRWCRLRKGKSDHNLCRACASLIRQNPRIEEGQKKYGHHKTGGGYIEVRIYPEDFFFPMANRQSYVLEHRLVMAKHLGRCLLSWEIVHHKGTKYPMGSTENKGDNRMENLELLPSPYKHNVLTKMGTHIRKLEMEIEEQRKFIKLLQWQINNIRLGQNKEDRVITE